MAAVPPLVIPRAFPRVRVPIVASWEKRLVDDAVVEKKLVVVPAVRESVPRVERPFTVRAPIDAVLALRVVDVAVPKYPVPDAVKFVEEAFTKCEVEDACMPALNHIGVEVELVAAP